MDLLADRGRRVSIEELNTGELLAHASRQAREPGRALPVVGKQPVDVGAEHAAVRRYGSLVRPIVERGEWPRAVAAHGDPHVHLVAEKRHAAIRPAADRLKPLLIGKNGFNVEQAETRDLARSAFDALHIGNRASQHLITAAQAEHDSATAPMRGDVGV